MIKKTGRPIKTPAPHSRVSLGLKVTSGLKAMIEAAAAESGRTQSQEAELRLELSFDREAVVKQTLASLKGVGLD